MSLPVLKAALYVLRALVQLWSATWLMCGNSRYDQSTTCQALKAIDPSVNHAESLVLSAARPNAASRSNATY